MLRSNFSTLWYRVLNGDERLASMTPDAIEAPQLTERQERILALVVHEYINKPDPVGSKYLAEHFLTNISSATIRNDLAVLEELGYVVFFKQKTAYEITVVAVS